MFRRYFLLVVALVFIVCTGSINNEAHNPDIHKRVDTWREARDFVAKIVKRTSSIDKLVVQSETLDFVDR